MKCRWPWSGKLLTTCSISILFALILPRVLYGITPPELDAVIESFKNYQSTDPNQSLNFKLDLAYKGLDLYAPWPNKAGTIDRDDRNILSEMKRLVIIDLVKQNGPVLISAIGSTGNWLIYPDKIKNDFNANEQEEIARFKHDGYYMEGLSDLDFATMGSQARSYVEQLHKKLAEGRNGHNITPQELEQLEISFLVDEQIPDISSGGNTRVWLMSRDINAISVDARPTWRKVFVSP